MKANYLNIYNNLIKLTRNKSLYLNLDKEETFSDRLIFLLLHLSFFLKMYKKSASKESMQYLHDTIFDQIEISIRELGYGDVSINKNMKKYVNLFYSILSDVDKWNEYDLDKKCQILNKLIINPKKISFYADYFDKLCTYYKNNTLNYFTKDIKVFKI